MELTGRTDWLALPLPPLSQKDAVMSAFRAARAEVSLQLGLMPAVVTDAEVQRRLEQAQRIQAQWPAGVSMRSATEAEILWIYGHSARRGLAEPFLPDGTETPVRGRGRNVAALGEILVGEGGAALASDFGSTDYTFSGPPVSRPASGRRCCPVAAPRGSWPGTRRSSSRVTSRWPCPGAAPSSATSAAGSTASRPPPAAPAPS
ncbi:hypothetical protein [Streptomyces sp. TLI_105]|uniref:hypothetical protein n=1 Tax=Streptomyces sp. TLI_105 TaxID=1881019 RepID=UPI002108B3AF|nr:hypothetical protein [Streptomyces sp. TLI_105]